MTRTRCGYAIFSLAVWTAFIPFRDSVKIDCTAGLLDEDGHHISLMIMEDFKVDLSCKCEPSKDAKCGVAAHMWKMKLLGDDLGQYQSHNNKPINIIINATAINPIFGDTYAELKDTAESIVVPAGNNISISYRLCASEIPLCQNHNRTCPGEFCIQTKNVPRGSACQTLDNAMCKATHGQIVSPHAACDKTGAKMNNLCEALASNKIVHYISMNGKITDYCSSTRKFWLEFEGNAVPMGSYVVFQDASAMLNSTCGEMFPAGSKLRCRLNRDGGEELTGVKQRLISPECGAPFALPLSFLNNYGRVRLTCFVEQGPIVSKTYISVLYLNKHLMIVQPDAKCTKDTLKFICGYPVSASVKGFSFQYELRNAKYPNELPTAIKDVKLETGHPSQGNYTCDAWAVYRACDPFQEIFINASRSNIVTVDCDHLMERNVAGMSPTFVGIVSSIVILIVLLIVVVSVLILKKRGVIGSKRWFNSEMRQDCNATNRCLLTSVEKLDESVAEMSTNQQVADNLLSQSVINPALTDARRESDGSLMTIATCTSPEIKCLKRTMVKLHPAAAQNLHMNVVFDFRMMPICLGQIPRIEEFNTFWRMIDELKVGVVVWLVNSFRELPLPFTVQGKKSQTYGDLAVKNVAVFGLADIFRMYELQFIHNDRPDKPRVLNFIEVGKWPGDSKVLDEVEFYATKQRRSDPKTRATMVVCRTGTVASCTFVAVYLARQMFFVQRQVNPAGVMRYVRRRRHGAFTTTVKAGGKLVQTVYSMLSASLRVEEVQEKVVGGVPAGGASLYSTRIDDAVAPVGGDRAAAPLGVKVPAVGAAHLPTKTTSTTSTTSTVSSGGKSAPPSKAKSKSPAVTAPKAGVKA